MFFFLNVDNTRSRGDYIEVTVRKIKANILKMWFANGSGAGSGGEEADRRLLL